MSEQINEAIRESEKDSDILQKAIIHGQLQPTELAEALSALQRQSLKTQRLLLTVGDGKFVNRSAVQPFIWLLYTLAGAIIATGVAVVAGRI